MGRMTSRIFMVGILCSPAVAGPVVATPDISPDAGVQAAIMRIEKAAGRDDARRQIDELAAAFEGDPAGLIGQMLWHSARHAGEPRSRAVVGQILRRLAAPKRVVVTSLVTHLDDRDAAIRGDAREMLKGYENRSATRPPDFSTYGAIIEEDVRAGREPRASLVQLMFESDAGAALTTMARGYQLRDPAEIKPILWAEHVVADLMWRRRFGFVGPRAVEPAATREIEAMSRHPRWWARLYAAEIVRANPELGTAGVVDRLAGDGNGLVRSVAMAAKAKQANG